MEGYIVRFIAKRIYTKENTVWRSGRSKSGRNTEKAMGARGGSRFGKDGNQELETPG